MSFISDETSIEGFIIGKEIVKENTENFNIIEETMPGTGE